MQVITRMESGDSFSGVSIALGTFDGVHLGHRRVIGRAVELAKQSGRESVVFTFENHPLSILNPQCCPPLITSLIMKERLLADLKVDILCQIPFTNDLLHLSPQQFVKMLLSFFSPSHIIVGPNYSFGYRGVGTPELLEQIVKEAGVAVEVQDAVYIDGSMVSSTSIRQYINNGDLASAGNLMGRSFSLSGRVVHGDGRGRVLGFPTANLQLPANQLLPADGVYAAYAIVNSQRLKALVNVGNNPTFNHQVRRVEVFILDFQGDLYEREISIEFCKYLRKEKVFANIQELQTRIEHDVLEGREYFNQKYS